MVEIVGYVASGLVVLSFMMTSVVRLRIVSLLGCIVFVSYGVLGHYWPVVITNTIVAILNIRFLYQEFTSKRDLAMVPIAADAPFLIDFLDSRMADIKHMQPNFELRPGAKVWLLTRDGLPTGVLAGQIVDDCLDIDLDYVTPRFRDSRMGQYIYGEGSSNFRALGIRRFRAHPGSADFSRYLRAMHFTQDGDHFSRNLD